MPKFTLGGDRLGSGAGMTIDTKTFNRTTHDLSYRLKTTASAGTLIPFMSKILLPGSSHNIKLNCDIMTGPTVGPLFGSFKVQLDMFTAPIRLYQPQLHNDKLGIGKKMDTIRFPLLRITVPNPKPEDGDYLDNFQFDPSHLLSYFDYRGMGTAEQENIVYITRDVNGLPVLALGDIYKNYYANKQENYGAYIHNELIQNNVNLANGYFQEVISAETGEEILVPITEIPPFINTEQFLIQNSTTLLWYLTNWDEDYPELNYDKIKVYLRHPLQVGDYYTITQLFNKITVQDIGLPQPDQYALACEEPTELFKDMSLQAPIICEGYTFEKDNNSKIPPRIKTFPLSDIDDRREDILSKIKETSHYIINDPANPINAEGNWYTDPYKYILDTDGTIKQTCTKSTQEGLFVKTYQNDILQTWLSKEVSQIDTLTQVRVHEDEDGGYIVLNEVNLNEKLYNFLNDVEASGGSYRDYIKVAYNTEMARITMSPVYIGGLSKELVFQQIISNAQAGDQPLGTLAGRGVLTDKHKGGSVRMNVDEPSIVIGLFSLTPRLDYSQGNTWQMDIVNMAQLHNPYFDQIGFQDLPLEWMYWIGTQKNSTDVDAPLIKQTIGKQPAWTHYTTDVNKVRGLFADRNEQQFMVINRQWESKWTVDATDPLNVLNKITIGDQTTYIDPVKYNFIFAQTDITSQNFWVQIDVDHEARMFMSGQPMPRI